jgi:hypothetical protein
MNEFLMRRLYFEVQSNMGSRHDLELTRARQAS